MQVKKNNESNFVYKDSKVVLLINGPTIKHSRKLKSGVNKINFYLNLKSQIQKICKMNFINVDDNETYEIFIKVRMILAKSSTTFSEVKNNLQFVRYSSMDKFYICLKKNYLPYEERLKEVIFDRFEKIKKFETNGKSSFNFFSKLSNEVINMAPEFDIAFIQKCLEILSNLKSDNINKNTDGIKSELKVLYKIFIKSKISLDQTTNGLP